MTRDEALALLHKMQYGEVYTHADLERIRTYILNSIPTPTVEVVKQPFDGGHTIARVNGMIIVQDQRQMLVEIIADALRAALEIEVKL